MFFFVCSATKYIRYYTPFFKGIRGKKMPNLDAARKLQLGNGGLGGNPGYHPNGLRARHQAWVAAGGSVGGTGDPRDGWGSKSGKASGFSASDIGNVYLHFEADAIYSVSAPEDSHNRVTFWKPGGAGASGIDDLNGNLGTFFLSAAGAEDASSPVFVPGALTVGGNDGSAI